MWRRVYKLTLAVSLLLAATIPLAAQPLGRTAPLVVVKQGLSSAINAVAFSADGRQALSGAHDNVLRLWDTATGQLVRVFDADTESVNAVAFSPVCCLVAAGGDDKKLRLWDMRTGILAAILAEHTLEVTAVAFSPDGRQVASGSKDQSVMLWDVITGLRFSTLSKHTGPVTAVAFSPDGKHLISASSDKTLILWDAATGQPINAPLTGHSDEVTSVAFSPNGRLAVSGAKDKTLQLWDVEAGGTPKLLGEHTSDVLSVAFSSDGRLILSASKDKTLKVWDVATGKLVRTLIGHTEAVTSGAISHDGRVISGSWDKTLKLWSADSGQLVSSIDVEATKFAPNGYIYPPRGNQLLPKAPDTAHLAERLQEKGLKRGDPVFLRIFKGDSEIELWIMRSARFELFATYPICAWSGQLGPKENTGDYQAPEGFYTIGKDQLNPNSKYHRAFNLGYPNAFDRAHGRTGANLMIHGSCGSVGCYAMTNPVIDEMWLLVNAAMDNGQERIAVHVFPFRMTDARMTAFAWHSAIEFWRDLKRGYDLFEASRIPPQVSVCNKRYAARRGDAGTRSASVVQALCTGN